MIRSPIAKKMGVGSGAEQMGRRRTKDATMRPIAMKSRKMGKGATMRRILRNEQANGKEMGDLRSFEMPEPCLLLRSFEKLFLSAA